MKNIVLMGSGGFAREVAWLIEQNNEVRKDWNILGFVDNEGSTDKYTKYPVIGNDEWLLEYTEEICAVICVANPNIRKKIALKFREHSNIQFPPIISVDARVGDSNTIKEGAIICAGAVITVNAQIGSFSIVNLDCTIGHEAILGNYVTLYPSVNVSGNVYIGDMSEMGTGSTVIQGIKIGHNAVVGASAAVVRDLPSNCTAVGVPAKVIKTKED